MSALYSHLDDITVKWSCHGSHHIIYHSNIGILLRIVTALHLHILATSALSFSSKLCAFEGVQCHAL